MQSVAARDARVADLRRQRRALGLSQEQLAHRLGVSFATVNRWERGRTQPRGTALSQLASLRALVPAERPLPAAPGVRNVPRQATSFVGRAAELERLVALVARSRLVTLTGAGGMGKTRLVSEALAGGRLPVDDGAAFVALDALATGADVAAAVEAALPNPADVGQLVLVLDNCEHVIDACRELVRRLLVDYRQMRIVATSREALGVAGESVIRLQPLAADDGQSAAVALFVDRVAERRPELRPALPARSDIALLCRRLDGLPLAIELAAGCLPGLSVAEMIGRLDDRLRLLVSTSTELPARQRELRAAIAWSYDLLDDRGQAMLAALSVFPASFGLEAAETVGAAAGKGSDDGDGSGLLTLATLAGKSLVETRAEGSTVRYLLLESVRQFARNQLDRRGETAAVMSRLYEWSQTEATRAEWGMAGRDQATWIERAGLDADAITSAVEWAVERRDAQRAVALAGTFWRYWYSRGDIARGTRLLAAALALPGEVTPAARAKALLGAGVLARQAGAVDAAVRYLREHLAMAQEAGDERAIAQAHNSLAGALHAGGDLEHAAQLLRRSLDWWERSGDRRGLASTLSNLGVIASDAGDQAAALDYGEQALALRLALGHAESIAISYENLGTAALRAGKLDDARGLMAEALRRYAELGEPDGIATALEGLAAVLPAPLAARILGTAERIRHEIAVPRAAAADRFQVELVGRLRIELGESAFEREQAAGGGLTIEEVVALVGPELAGSRAVAPAARRLRRRLTGREREVLALIGEGHSTKEMAARLGLSTRTVERHLANIYAKIGARGRADAIAFALSTASAERS